MDKYFYLISQLPSLTFDKSSYMTTDLFLEEAEKWLDGRDFKLLSKIELGSIDLVKQFPGSLQTYQKVENEFRNEVAAYRKANKEDLDYKPSLFPTSTLKEGNPLEIEKKLLFFRWQLIEEMEVEHHFNLAFIMLYYLKLQILQKLAQFDKQKGMEKFQKVSKVTL